MYAIRSYYGVALFWTNAEYPPIKSTPTSFAMLSSVIPTSTHASIASSLFNPFKVLPMISPIGVTEIRLFTIGIPYFLETLLAVSTKFPPSDVISYNFV